MKRKKLEKLEKQAKLEETADNYSFVSIKIEGTEKKIILILLSCLFALFAFILFPLFYKTVIYGDESNYEIDRVTTKTNEHIKDPKEEKIAQEQQIKEEKEDEKAFWSSLIVKKQKIVAGVSENLLDVLIVVILGALFIVVSYKKVQTVYLKRKISTLQMEQIILGELLEKLEAQYKEGKITESRYLVRREIYKERENTIEISLPEIKARVQQIQMPVIYDTVQEKKEVIKEKKNKEVKKQSLATYIKR